MNKSFISSAIFFIFSGAQAADISFTPPSDGGFSINSQNGSSIFRVDPAKNSVIIKNLPSTFGDTPLCWNSSTGALAPCTSGSVGGGGKIDTTPPNITSNAPAIATSSNMPIEITCSDDSELLACGQSFGQMIAPGVKNITRNLELVSWSLGEEYNLVYAAADMSGNASKKLINIKTPSTGIPFKTFKNISPNNLPNGFSCSPNRPDLDGQKIEYITTQANYLGNFQPISWSIADGYNLRVYSNIFQLSTDTAKFPSESKPLIPLDAQDVIFPITIAQEGSGPQPGTYAIAYTGNLKYNPSKDEISLEVVMNCGFTLYFPNDMTDWNWTQGTPLTITAKP